MTEPVAQPIFFVVDEDPSAVETLVGDLERRFQADFQVMGETSAQAALERLGALRESGEQVALIICYESMCAMPGSELLARSRSTHPDAKRILLIDYGDMFPAARRVRLPGSYTSMLRDEGLIYTVPQRGSYVR